MTVLSIQYIKSKNICNIKHELYLLALHFNTMTNHLSYPAVGYKIIIK